MGHHPLGPPPFSMPSGQPIVMFLALHGPKPGLIVSRPTGQTMAMSKAPFMAQNPPPKDSGSCPMASEMVPGPSGVLGQKDAAVNIS